MENAYGIGITNRFALFLEEESDPLDILKQGEAQKLAAKTKKIEAATKPEAKAPAKKNDAGKSDNICFHQLYTPESLATAVHPFLCVVASIKQELLQRHLLNNSNVTSLNE